MMGKRPAGHEVLFYGLSLERHVPPDHLLRWIDRFVDLAAIRQALRPFYSEVGRPSTDPELMIRMLLAGCCFGIRSERRLYYEVHLSLAYSRSDFSYDGETDTSHLSGRQTSEASTAPLRRSPGGGASRRDLPLPSQQDRLRCLQPQAGMLPERGGPQGPPLYPRGRTRPGPRHQG
jgi:hypothetical protein